MRRVRYHTHGAPGVLVIEEAGVPEPGPGQVLIRTEAIGLNYVDVQMRQATSPDSLYHRPLPSGITGDVVGTVERAGPDAAVTAGSRVAVLLADAGADYVVADADWLAPVPEGLDVGAASMLPMAGPVALGTLRAGRLAKGETVLVEAGAGGIGHLAVQLARQLGAGTVIATAGSPAKLEFVRSLGADVAVDHTSPDWAGQVRAAAPGGIDVALDGVGGDVLHQAIALLAPQGRVVVFGASSGDLTSVPARSMFLLKTLTTFSLLGWRAADPEQARADIAEITAGFETGRLRAAADTRLPLADVARAFQLIEDRTVNGRVLLIP